MTIPIESVDSTHLFGVDLYSHRFIPTHSVGEVQFQLHCEGLIRNRVGTVGTNEWTVTHKTPLMLEIMDALLQKYAPIATARDRGIFLYYFGQSWAAKVVQIQQISGSTIKVNRLIVTFVSSKADLLSAFEESLGEMGFVIVNEWEEKVGGTTVSFAFPGSQGVDYHSRAFTALPLDSIQRNYTPELVGQTRQVISRVRGVTSGLVLLGGVVGVGKSYLIRALLTELSDERRAVVCSPASKFLREAGMLTEVLARFEKSIIVFEDVGSILEMDAPLVESDQRSNLLNLSEGLLSLLADSIIVLSFNHEPSKIDPAVWRPGRCLGYLKLESLAYEQAENWLGDDGKLPEKRAYSLAELYELKRGGTLTAAFPGSRKMGILR